MSLPEHIHSSTPKRGVLLVNLGTPDAPTAPAIRRYLREFLSDRRVVEFSRLFWLPVLYGFILPFRPLKLVHAYQSIWTPQGSPLLAISRRQQAALQAALGPEVPVTLAMRYGQPAIADALNELGRQDVRRIVVLPLYPQYSATTTATVLDKLFALLRAWRWLPELRTINQYHDDAGYIDALADSVQAQWLELGRGEHLLMSFHSIPLAYFRAGDPYFCHCHKTARLLAERLGLSEGQWSVSFQSRLGRTPWLQPYTEPQIQKLAKGGLRKLDVICPGFSADCLETLEEIALRYGESFRKAGGEALRYIPALNDSPAHIAALKKLVERELAGWEYPAESVADLEARVARADRVGSQS
ncbi:ferrochelatase [Solimonas sp. K1W22B-7]|uniref:ferrochelatase n=1 Tax=Solimonas sp. K1W22B-7 TaxID=2303331 RepID=UPI000E33603B|nr:ferrochelatase [Solimonas sp. K1W22B-7]AXQ28825.1 ferrochelatase [Solimonas sp. K1W22B-7]